MRGARLAQPHAAAAAPSCRQCARLVVEEHERGSMSGTDLCSCVTPDVRPGKVAMLAGPMAAEFVEELHGFDGRDGGVDDLVDAASAAFNAVAETGSVLVVPGLKVVDGVIVERTPVTGGPGPRPRRGLHRWSDEEVHRHQPMPPLGRPIRVKDGL